MVDLFEQENPGYFDDPTHTFAALAKESKLAEFVEKAFGGKL